MKVVIDISKKLYDRYKEKDHIKRCDIDEFEKALNRCIILPKGHGAIKDVSQIEIPMCEDRRYEKWVQVAINSAPTLIEADTGKTEAVQYKNGWIYGEDKHGQDGYYCPNCYKHIPLFYDKQDMDFIKAYKYCPFCGVEIGETHD